MSNKKHKFGIRNAQKNILAGALVLTPLLATWLVVEFLFNTLSRLGRPGASTFFTAIYRFSPEFAEGLSTPWVEYVIAVVLTLVMLYFLGWATTRVLRRRILGWFEALLERVPLVKTIYGGIKIFLAAFQTKPEGVERVVLINFPSPEMKTIGFVTRILIDEASGQELAVVYVPTAPNPTSGYIQIVPVAELISTDWTLDEAMRFVITAGTTAPNTITFRRQPHELSQPLVSSNLD